MAKAISCKVRFKDSIRLKADLCMLYKMWHGLVHVGGHFCDYFTCADMRTRGHSCRLRSLFCRSDTVVSEIASPPKEEPDPVQHGRLFPKLRLVLADAQRPFDPRGSVLLTGQATAKKQPYFRK